jgi:cell division protein FtsB
MVIYLTSYPEEVSTISEGIAERQSMAEAVEAAQESNRQLHETTHWLREKVQQLEDSNQLLARQIQLKKNIREEVGAERRQRTE